MARWMKINQQNTGDVGENCNILEDVGLQDAEYGLDRDVEVVDEEKTHLMLTSTSRNVPNGTIFRFRPVLLLSICCFLSSLILYVFMYYHAPSDAACGRKLWSYSPQVKAVEFGWRQYDSDVIPEKYFGPPTAERRYEWKLIYDQGNIGYPEEELERINKTWEGHNWWRLPPPMEHEILALPESVHQMHCVSFMWMYAYRDLWDWKGLMNMTDLEFSLHTQHCSRVLYTIVMCQADVSPVLFQTDSSGLGAWKTRNVPHKCKNSEKMSDWQINHRVCQTNCIPGLELIS